MEPEKEQNVSFSSVCCSFIGDGHFSCCFADCCCFRSFVRESDGSKESLNLHLVQLLNEAEKQLEEKSQPSSSPVRVDLDKHVALWKRRVRILRKMKSGLEQLSESNSI
jgi:hypothetical protein